MYKITLIAVMMSLLFQNVEAHGAERVKIRWNGDFPHNNDKTFSKDYRLGWSKNFMNGFPEEGSRIQRDGFLDAEISKPAGAGPFPFLVVMHGCGGLEKVALGWARDYARIFNGIGVGTLILDSFSARRVESVCALPYEGDWARRRSQDAYSALEYLATTGYADMSHAYLLGRSNGGSATLLALENIMARNQPYKFKTGFALVPGCGTKIKAQFLNPLVAFIAGQDDANRPGPCIEMGEFKRKADHPPLKVIVYETAFHGYMDDVPFRHFLGWRMGYNSAAAQDTVQVVAKIMRGLEPVGSGVERK